MKLARTLHLLILLTLLGSCNVFKIADNHTKGKLKRGGLEHTLLETDNYTFSYWDTKEIDKPVYMLFHGFGSPANFQWYQQAKALSKTHRLILPNLLYFGSKPKGTEKYSIQEQVNAMSELLNALEIDSMVLGGISYGGLVAAELAMLEKEKIRKLTIFSSPVKFFNDGDLAAVESNAGVDDISELLVPADVDMMRQMFDVVLYKDRNIPKFILRDMQENLFGDETQSKRLKALLNEIQSGKEYFINRDYQFDFPVLLIWGADDELIPARIGTELKAYIPTSTLHLIPKAGHGPNVEQKKVFNEILLEFLRE
ncbi:MAG: alpha/beta hydrolase [Cyclobacteriaceae bacterium]